MAYDLLGKLPGGVEPSPPRGGDGSSPQTSFVMVGPTQSHPVAPVFEHLGDVPSPARGDARPTRERQPVRQNCPNEGWSESVKPGQTNLRLGARVGRVPTPPPIPNRQERFPVLRERFTVRKTAGQSNRQQPIVHGCARGRARSGSGVRMRPRESRSGLWPSPTQSNPVQVKLASWVSVHAPARGDARATRERQPVGNTTQAAVSPGRSHLVKPI
jgi:hypothetical protein